MRDYDPITEDWILSRLVAIFRNQVPIHFRLGDFSVPKAASTAVPYLKDACVID